MECIKDFTLQHIQGKFYLFFPEYEIEDYDQLKSIIGKILGKYKKHKGKSCFVFDSAPEPYLKLIEKGEYPNIRKDNQFFETPKKVWMRIFDEIGCYFKPFAKVLEPSAGKGSMISAMAEWHLSNWYPTQFLSYQVHLIENYEPNRFFLKELSDRYMRKGMPLILTPDCDFLKTNIDNQYDIITANPPFNKGQAEKHLEKMVLHLKKDGVMAVILPPNVKKEPVFTQLTSKYYTKCFDLEKGDFKASGTNIQCFVLILSKTPFKQGAVPKPYFKMRIPEVKGLSQILECDKEGTVFTCPKLTDDVLDCFYLPKVIQAPQIIESPKPVFQEYRQLMLDFG